MYAIMIQLTIMEFVSELTTDMFLFLQSHSPFFHRLECLLVMHGFYIITVEQDLASILDYMRPSRLVLWGFFFNLQFYVVFRILLSYRLFLLLFVIGFSSTCFFLSFSYLPFLFSASEMSNNLCIDLTRLKHKPCNSYAFLNFKCRCTHACFKNEVLEDFLLSSQIF